MIIVNRDELVKKKGNLEIPHLELDLNYNFDFSTIIDLLMELFLKYNNKEDKDYE